MNSLIDDGNVQPNIAIIQFRLEVGASTAYSDVQIRLLVHRAALSGANLVVLPLLAGHQWLNNEINTPLENLPSSNLPNFTDPGSLAVTDKIYLIIGPFLELHDTGWQIGLKLFGPEGDFIGWQGQTHLNPTDVARGIVGMDTLEVWETKVGRIGLVVGNDTTIPEISRILCKRGAQVLVTAGAMPAPYHEARQLMRLWREVQLNEVFGVEAYIVGESNAWSYAGRSALIAPSGMTIDQSGYLAIARETVSEEIITGVLDYNSLRTIRATNSVTGFANQHLYRRKLPEIYNLK